MANRNERALIASETMQILSSGLYVGPSGKTVSADAEIQDCVNETRLYRPGQLSKLGASVPERSERARVEVRNCSTLAAARKLRESHGEERVALLNFASARNPGGGFLSGSQAQEESLARASALYASIERMTEYYEANRRHRSALYTDHMIYSPRVPVFRDEADRLLDDPWSVSMITAPAVNAGVVRMKEPENAGRIGEVMRRRIVSVLALAAHHGHDALVLGAWGCGVFGNDPVEIAESFAEQLLDDGSYARAFSEVVFAVLDKRGDIIRPFVDVLGSRAS